MSKVFEFLDKIEANDKRRIERIDKEKQSMIESLKKFRKEREKLVPQLKKAMEKRKKDHDEFFELKKKYQAAAEEKIKENEKIHADLLAGRISVAKHQATYKKPADVRAEFDEKFFAEFEKTLDLLRGHDLEIKKLELDILKLDAKITQFEGTVFDIEEKITKEKLEDFKKYNPGNMRIMGTLDRARQKEEEFRIAATGGYGRHYFIDVKSAEELELLPLNSVFQKKDLPKILDIVSKYREFEFKPNVFLKVDYLATDTYGEKARLNVQQIGQSYLTTGGV